MDKEVETTQKDTVLIGKRLVVACNLQIQFITFCLNLSSSFNLCEKGSYIFLIAWPTTLKSLCIFFQPINQMANDSIVCTLEFDHLSCYCYILSMSLCHFLFFFFFWDRGWPLLSFNFITSSCSSKSSA